MEILWSGRGSESGGFRGLEGWEDLGPVWGASFFPCMQQDPGHTQVRRDFQTRCT